MEMNRIQDSWTNFIMGYGEKFGIAFPKPFTVRKKPHVIQRDANNCGVFCLMFAERHMSGESIMNISGADLQLMRKKVAETLMLYEVFLTDCCPKCGCHVADEDEKMQCSSCGRFYHFKTYCVEEDLLELSTIGESAVFVCRLCRIDFWPVTALTKEKGSTSDDHRPKSVSFSNTSEMIRKLHEDERDVSDVLLEELTCSEKAISTKRKPIQSLVKASKPAIVPSNPAIVPSNKCVVKHSVRSLRKSKKKEKRRSFVYPKVKKNTRKFCICNQKNDGRTYWQCESCEEWYHPECIGCDVNLEPESFICNDCKQNVDTIADANAETEDSKEHEVHVDGKEEKVKRVIDDLYEMMQCSDKNCTEEDHRRHHAFLLRPLEVIKAEKRKFGFGMNHFPSETIESILDFVTENIFVNKFKDPDHPYRGQFVGIHKLSESSALHRLLKKYDVADKYNIFVLLKEILIILQMKNTEQPYCVAEEKLEADEFIV